tara:strand:- start:2822 stop:4324 length:1503 start_codon:yes stop_codon:yes gene_type:complete
MSIFRSYFSKNNTIIANSKTNTAKNPVTQIFYGKNVAKKCTYTGYSGHTCDGVTGFSHTAVNGYSRFLFDLDLDDIKNKIDSCCLLLNSATTHCLKMVNTSNFDDSLLNDKVLVGDTRRATSFTLMLFKAVSGSSWSEGVGYDYQRNVGMFEPEFDITHSTRPSHWFSATTLVGWTFPGTYLNTLGSSFTPLATQYFDNGNENINLCSTKLTREVNELLTAATSTISANTYGIAFLPAFENLTGLTEAYSVGFFTKYTQTFYEPFLETDYNDVISDDRGNFNLNIPNRLFLYLYDYNGNPMCSDTQPMVNIVDCNGVTQLTLTSTTLTCGAYYIDLAIPNLPLGQQPPVEYEDIWSNITINGIPQPPVTNEFIIYDNAFNIGVNAGTPKIYGYSVSGVKENEKISTGETRKVFISTRVPYTVSQQVLVDNLQYRVYVTQGTTQVEVIPWSPVNMSFTHNYFLLDTSWMIPNEYYIDIKATSNQQVDIYSKQIKFQIVNQL